MLAATVACAVAVTGGVAGCAGRTPAPAATPPSPTPVGDSAMGGPASPVPSTRADRGTPTPTAAASTGPHRLPPLPAGAVVVGRGTPASCTQDTLLAGLRTLQRKGSGTLGFDCGPGPVTIAVRRNLPLGGSGRSAYTIDGRGTVTLDGGGRSGLFVLGEDAGMAVTFRRLSLRHARTGTQGAAIHGGWRNRLTIEDCTFVGNVSTAARSFDGGGALYVHEGSATVRRSLFEGNTATNGGGIQNTIGDLTVEDTVFRGNRSTVRGSGGGGGALYSDSGSLVLRRSRVSGNTAAFQGGGLFLYNARERRTVIEDSTIDGNRVTDRPDAFGGGIRSGNGPVDIRRTTFRRNNAVGQGGALYTANDARVTLTDCRFVGNTAGQGGALFRVNGSIAQVRSTFSGNVPGNVL